MFQYMQSGRASAGQGIHRLVRRFAMGAMLAALCLPAAPVQAQDFPAKPIKWIVAFTAGGPTDTIARIVGAKMTEAWGQPVIIENQGGAGGTIAANMTAKAAPDGYTILYVSASHAITPAIYKSLPYDTVNDFAPIGVIANTPFVLVVSPTLPVNNVSELIALAKAKPGQLSFASSGIGASNHLAGELFKALTGTNITHVPYKGQSQTTADLMSGEVSMTFGSPVQALPLIAAKKVKVIGVSTKGRYAPLPDVLSVEEQGVAGYETGTWHGALAPRGTPVAVVNKLSAEIARSLKLSDVQVALGKIGVTPVGSTPGEFSALLKSEVLRWADVAKRAGVEQQ